MRFILILALGLSVSACVTGPETEKKSPLNVLNGENYNTNPDGRLNSVASIPIIERKERLTKISGHVYVIDSFAHIPLRMQMLHLKSNGKVIHKAASDEKGEYLFSEVLKNGKYEIELASDKYQGRVPVNVSNYENPNFDIQATKK